MNLETTLPPDMWAAIRVNYEKGDFTAAIQDCGYYISELLRQKSGADGDGVPLVGQALGGANPKIRVAKDQSITEQDIQRGIEQILRGFYQAIRNPRSHKKILDSADDATSIIAFCGYIVRQLQQAKALASKEELIRRVLDKDFVPQENYARLLVDEIPSRLKLEVFLGVFEKRSEWKSNAIYYFNKVIISDLSAEDQASVVSLISDELKTTDDEVSIRHVISGFPPEMWERYAEIARLRVEHKIIRSISEGRYDLAKGRCLAGELATWARGCLTRFMSRRPLLSALATKIRSENSQERGYVITYFLGELHQFETEELGLIFAALTHRLKKGDETLYDALLFLPLDNRSADFDHAYKNFIASPNVDLDDEIPF
jgi:uncharacterized protein (TIGR02391 family)